MARDDAEPGLQPASGPEPKVEPPKPALPSRTPDRVTSVNAAAVTAVAPPAPEPVARVADETEAAVSGNAAEAVAVLPLKISLPTPPAPLPVTSPQQAMPMPPEPAAKPAVLAPPKRPVPPAAPSFALQLASLKSEEAAAGESVRLQRQLGNALDGQAITVERATVANRGVFYRLKLGNFPSAKQAATLCKALKEKKQSCLVVRQ